MYFTALLDALWAFRSTAHLNTTHFPWGRISLFCFSKHAKNKKVCGGRGEEGICKAWFQNSFPCKFMSAAFSICFQRMEDNKLLFHLLFWQADLALAPAVSQPTAPNGRPHRTSQTDPDTLHQTSPFGLIYNWIGSVSKEQQAPMPRPGTAHRGVPTACSSPNATTLVTVHSYSPIKIAKW